MALCLLPTATVNAQSDQVWDFVKTKLFGKEYLEIGGQIGAAGYMGEMNNQVFGSDNKSFLGFNSYSGGVSIKRYFNPISAKDRTWGIRLDYNFSNIKGDDASSSVPSHKDRDLRFTNNIHEIGMMGEFHFYEFRPNRFRNIVTPYVFAGVGMIYHNPKAEDADGKRVSLIDEKVELRKISYEKDGSGNFMLDTLGNLKVTNSQKYRKVAAIIPFGAGVKLNGKGSLAPFAIGLELNYRYVFSDFLDGIGNREYHDYSVVNPRKPNDAAHLNDWDLQRADWEQLAGPHKTMGYADLVNRGETRGQKEKGNDSYMTAVIRLTYTFYRWRDPMWKK